MTTTTSTTFSVDALHPTHLRCDTCGAAVCVGLFGAILGAVLANGTNLFRHVEDNTDLVPLLTACTSAIIGAIAGAVDAVVVAIDRQAERRKTG